MEKKICSKCLEPKPIEDFYKGNTQCKKCSNGRKRIRTKYNREYKRRKRAKVKDEA